MALTDEAIKQIFQEIEKFLNETLKKEKLSRKSLDHKQGILDKLAKVYEDNPQLQPSPSGESLQVKETDESLTTGGSSRSDESEDTSLNYIDAGIGLIAAGDLTDVVYSGTLDKKQKKGTGLLGPKFQTRWCAISKGVFYYYEKQKDKKQCGSFRLEGYRFRNAPDITSKKKEKELSFELCHADDTRRIYQFVAKSKADYEQWQQFTESGGLPLIEEDIYEEVGNDMPAPPLSPSSEHPPVAEEEYVMDVQVQSDAIVEPELYEDPDGQKPPPPPSTGPKSHRMPPPPPPESTLPHLPAVPTPPAPGTPVLPGKTETERPVSPIQEDIYDEAMSRPNEPQTAPVEPPVPERPTPPEVPKPSGKRGRMNRELPELPPTPDQKPAKKKIKVNITCRPEEDFENRYFGKWDCNADKPNELSFKRGDVIYVVSRDFEAKSWWVGELNGKFGLVPKDYLTPAFVLVETK